MNSACQGQAGIGYLNAGTPVNVTSGNGGQPVAVSDSTCQANCSELVELDNKLPYSMTLTAPRPALSAPECTFDLEFSTYDTTATGELRMACLMCKLMIGNFMV